MKKIKILMMSFFVFSCCFINVSCANKDLKYFTTTTEELKKQTKYLVSRVSKGYTTTVYNIINLYIKDYILEKNGIKVDENWYYNVAMPVGTASIYLRIDFNEKNSKKEEKFLKEKILNNNLNNIIKNKLKDKKNLKVELGNCLQKYRENIKKEKEKFKNIIKKLEKEPNQYSEQGNFYIEKYAKPAIYSRLEKTKYLEQEKTDSKRDTSIPDYFIQDYEKNKNIEQILKDRETLIKIGNILYKKEIEKLKSYLKNLEKRNKFDEEIRKTHKENTDEIIIEHAIKCLEGEKGIEGIMTDEELVNDINIDFYESFYHLKDCLQIANKEIEEKNKIIKQKQKIKE